MIQWPLLITKTSRLFLAAFLINKLIRPLMSFPPRSDATSFHHNFSDSKPVSKSVVFLQGHRQEEKGACSRPPLGHCSHARTCELTDKQSLPFSDLSEATDAVNLKEGSYLGCRLRKQDTWLAAPEVLPLFIPTQRHRGGKMGHVHSLVRLPYFTTIWWFFFSFFFNTHNLTEFPIFIYIYLYFPHNFDYAKLFKNCLELCVSAS